MDQFIQIRVYFKNELLREAVFKPSTVVLGRGSDCHLVLDNAGVSRHHAEVRINDQGQLTLRDMQSGNGTFVNGQQVDETEIATTDSVAIGKFSLKISLTDIKPDSSEADQESVTADDINQTVCLRPNERQQILSGAESKATATAATTPSRAPHDTAVEPALSPWFVFTAGVLTGFVICGIIALF